jgi:hypothetical protein
VGGLIGWAVVRGTRVIVGSLTGRIRSWYFVIINKGVTG